jgi:hypothetical protein
MEKELPKHMRTAKNSRCAKSRRWCTESDPTIRRRRRQKHLTSKRNRRNLYSFEEKYRNRKFESEYQSSREFKEQCYHEINRLCRGKSSKLRMYSCP